MRYSAVQDLLMMSWEVQSLPTSYVYSEHTYLREFVSTLTRKSTRRDPNTPRKNTCTGIHTYQRAWVRQCSCSAHTCVNVIKSPASLWGSIQPWLVMEMQMDWLTWLRACKLMHCWLPIFGSSYVWKGRGLMMFDDSCHCLFFIVFLHLWTQVFNTIRKSDIHVQKDPLHLCWASYCVAIHCIFMYSACWFIYFFIRWLIDLWLYDYMHAYLFIYSILLLCVYTFFLLSLCLSISYLLFHFVSLISLIVDEWPSQ